MKILFLNTDYKITLVPKVEIIESDNLTITLRNEMTKVLTDNIDFTFEINGNYIEITLENLPIGAKAKDKFEFEVKKGAISVYIGKVLVLTDGTNVQNYTNERSRFQ